MATPFVQGQLLEKNLSCTVETECSVSKRQIEIELDSELSYRVNSSAEQPMLFIPMIDLGALEAPSIVDDFWMKSVFFWSEEEARTHRAENPKPKGIYLTLRQSAIVIKPIQSILFGFTK